MGGYLCFFVWLDGEVFVQEAFSIEDPEGLEHSVDAFEFAAAFIKIRYRNSWARLFHYGVFCSSEGDRIISVVS